MRDLSRREMLALGLATGLAAAAPAWAQAGKKPVSIALDWTPNTNHIGLYVARDKGFYADAGLEVSILPYTDTSAGTLVANRVADFGILGSIGLFTQRTAGAPLKAIYAVVQTETGRVVFNDARKDIVSPKDLDGKIYGGFGSDWENALIGTIIKHDGGKGEFETVTLGTSAYEALANGSVDFTLEVYTWEGIKAELDGKAQRGFRYADYGVPDQHTTFIGSSDGYLSENGATAKAFMEATRKGYAFAADNIEAAADIIIAANADALTDRALIVASLKALSEGHYLRTADGVIGTIDAKKIAALGEYLVTSGILRDGEGKVVTGTPDFSGYFDNRYLDG